MTRLVEAEGALTAPSGGAGRRGSSRLFLSPPDPPGLHYGSLRLLLGLLKFRSSRRTGRGEGCTGTTPAKWFGCVDLAALRPHPTTAPGRAVGGVFLALFRIGLKKWRGRREDGGPRLARDASLGRASEEPGAPPFPVSLVPPSPPRHEHDANFSSNLAKTFYLRRHMAHPITKMICGEIRVSENKVKLIKTQQ